MNERTLSLWWCDLWEDRHERPHQVEEADCKEMEEGASVLTRAIMMQQERANDRCMQGAAVAPCTSSVRKKIGDAREGARRLSGNLRICLPAGCLAEGLTGTHAGRWVPSSALLGCFLETGLEEESKRYCFEGCGWGSSFLPSLPRVSLPRWSVCEVAPAHRSMRRRELTTHKNQP